MKTVFFLSLFLIAGNLFQQLLTTQHKDATVAAYTVSKVGRASSTPVMPLRIVIDKSNYELYVYDAKGWYATYPVVFGNNPLMNKKMEGDRCTPEGNFKISAKRVHNKWSRFIALDYPTKEDIARFEALKQRDEVPSSARPGGGIGIHGTWPHEDFVIDRYKNWTNGCISLKREDVEELYSYVPVGTTVTIKK